MVAPLIRMAGTSAIGGGLLFMIGVAAHPLRDGFTIQSLGWLYGAEHAVILLGLLLQTVGIIGLQIWQIQRGTPIGSAAFLSALLGLVSWTMVITIDATWNPLLALYRPEDVHIKMDDPLIMAIMVAGMLTFATGHLLLGRHVMHAQGLPALTGVLLAIGGPVYIFGGMCIFLLGPQSWWVTAIETAGAIPSGIAFIWLGHMMRVG